MTVPRIGILGFAHGHVGTYCGIWKTQPEAVRLVAGWDHDAKRAETAAGQYEVELAESAQLLCARTDIDTVVIGAETSLHAELVEHAAAAGKAIILQKPLALTLEQADRIVAAVNRHRVPFTLAWQMRVDPQNLKIKELLASGAFGRLFMIRRRHGLSTHTWPGFENSWHASPVLNRGMWADDASHPIDFFLWLLGKPATVMAEIATLHNAKVPDDNGLAIFRYPDGALAELACSFTCLAGENTTEIVSEKGVIIQNFGDAPSANVARPPGGIGLKWRMQGDQQWTISDIPSPNSQSERIAALAPELLNFLQGRRPPICTAEEGRTSLAMTLACYRSAETGQRITIDDS